MSAHANLSRRRTSNSPTDSSIFQNESVNERGALFQIKNLLKCGSLVILLNLFLLITFDLSPGLVSPFGFSTRWKGRSGRSNIYHPNTPSIKATPNVIPWKEWEHKHNANQSHPYAGSMANRHLFGRGVVEDTAMQSDRSSVARVMIFKLPRSGSTWFTELLNALPTVFISKEIIQAELDVAYTQHERLRHLKRALIWPTGKMSTGPWGGRFGSVKITYFISLSLPSVLQYTY